mmetsp:Transcript_23371/g.55322  ORF Transcript_23371/g.55322 Transcript_23371/m.55322 type:complete len:212 (-) Transcript_23371:867-1502(-)
MLRLVVRFGVPERRERRGEGTRLDGHRRKHPRPRWRSHRSAAEQQRHRQQHRTSRPHRVDPRRCMGPPQHGVAPREDRDLQDQAIRFERSREQQPVPAGRVQFALEPAVRMGSVPSVCARAGPEGGPRRALRRRRLRRRDDPRRGVVRVLGRGRVPQRALRPPGAVLPPAGGIVFRSRRHHPSGDPVQRRRGSDQRRDGIAERPTRGLQQR